ncbi:hypothetical protein ACFWP3_40630 [Streptomyces sp. NPDC058525]
MLWGSFQIAAVVTARRPACGQCPVPPRTGRDWAKAPDTGAPRC